MLDERFDRLDDRLDRVEKGQDRLERGQGETNERLAALSENYAGFKGEMSVKAGVWGLAGGLLPALGALFYWLAKR